MTRQLNAARKQAELDHYADVYATAKDAEAAHTDAPYEVCVAFQRQSEIAEQDYEAAIQRLCYC